MQKNKKTNTDRIKNDDDFQLPFFKFFIIIMLGFVLLLSYINMDFNKFNIEKLDGFVLFVKNFYYTLSDPLTLVFIPFAILVSLRICKKRGEKMNSERPNDCLDDEPKKSKLDEYSPFIFIGFLAVLFISIAVINHIWG